MGDDLQLLHFQYSKKLNTMVTETQNFVNSLVLSARKATFAHFSVLSDESIDKSFITHDIMDNKTKHLQPLSQFVSPAISQLISSNFTNFFSHPQDFIYLFFSFFERYPNYKKTFGYLSFPAIFSYFITTEYTERAFNFLYCTILTKNFRKELTIYMISSYFDCFPRFLPAFFTSFENSFYTNPNLGLLKRFFISFRYSVSFLTTYHVNLLSLLFRLDDSFFFQFFLTYFITHSSSRLLIITNEPQEPFYCQLIDLFKTILNQKDSPLRDSIQEEILNLPNPGIQKLHFATHFNVPLTTTIVSVHEAQLLFSLFKYCNFIKKNQAVEKLTIEASLTQSFEPCILQLSYRQVFGKPNETGIPGDDSKIPLDNDTSLPQTNYLIKYTTPCLIFPNCNKTLPKSSELTGSEKEKREEMKRIWRNIVLVADEANQDPFDMINNPKTPYSYNVIKKYKIIQSKDFSNYLNYKKEKEIIRSQKMFEEYITKQIALQQSRELKDSFKSYFEMWTNCCARKYFASLRGEILIHSQLSQRADDMINERFSYMIKLAKSFEVNTQYQTEHSPVLPFEISNKDSKLEDGEKRNFPECINVLGHNNFTKKYTIHFLAATADEWEENSVKIIYNYHIFALNRYDQLKNEPQPKGKISFGPKFNQIMKTSTGRKVLLYLQSFRGKMYGQTMLKLTDFLTTMRSVSSQLNADYAEFVLNLFCLSGVDEIIIALAWFHRFDVMCNTYLPFASNDVKENFNSVINLIFKILKETDTVYYEQLESFCKRLPK